MQRKHFIKTISTLAGAAVLASLAGYGFGSHRHNKSKSYQSAAHPFYALRF